MDIAYSSAMQATNGDLAATLQSLAPLLQTELTMHGAKAEWDVRPIGPDRSVVALRVSDSTGGQATKEFSRNELKNDALVKSRLDDLKGAVIWVGGFKAKVEALFQSLEEWIRRFDPQVFIERRPLEIREQKSGSYDTEVLRLTTNGSDFRITPVGAWVVGADGRVDVVGPTDRVILVVNGYDWFRVLQGSNPRLEQLDEQTFLQLLEECRQ